MADRDLTERLAEAMGCVLGYYDDHDDHGRVIAPNQSYCTEHGDDWPCRWGPLVWLAVPGDGWKGRITT